jgi:creatinine amidohydrolase
MLSDVLEGPPEETPGWHSGELETSQCLAHNDKLVRMERAETTRAKAPAWLGDAWAKKDGMPDAEFQGFQYFNFPFEHAEFTPNGVMGVPSKGSAEKGEVAFRRFTNHLIDAVHELEKVKLPKIERDWTAGKTMGGGV